MKLFMFDMDGTLIDSGDVIVNTVNYVRTHLGLEPMEKYFMLEHLNDPNINSAEFFYGTKIFTPEQTVLFEEYYNENCVKDIKIYDGIDTLLEELKKKDYSLAVATNSGAKFASKMLSHLNIKDAFDIVVGYDDVVNPKPHPEMLYKIMDNYPHIKKDKCTLIGDSHKDTGAADAANINSILVNWGFSNHDKNDKSIKSIEQLKQILL